MSNAQPDRNASDVQPGGAIAKPGSEAKAPEELGLVKPSAELLAWARQRLTAEEIDELRRGLEEMARGGGLKLTDFLPELDELVRRS